MAVNGVEGSSKSSLTVEGSSVSTADPVPGLAKLGSNPVVISLSGAELPRGGAVVSRRLETAVPASGSAALAYLDETTNLWTSVPTTLSPDRRTLTARVSHFSIWDDIYYGITSVASKRVDPPDCHDSTPGWVKDAIFVQDINAPVVWCVGNDPRHKDWLVVKVRANRAYGFGVTTSAKPQWTYSTFGHDTGLKDVVIDGLNQANIGVQVAQQYMGVHFLPPGEEIDFGFTEHQVRSAHLESLVQVSADPFWELSGALYDALAQAGGKTDAALFSVIGWGQCLHDFSAAGELGAKAASGFNCLLDHRDEILTTVEQVAPKLHVRVTGADTKFVGRALAAVEAFFIGAQIVDLLADAQLDPAARRLTVVLQTVNPFAGNWSVHGSNYHFSKNGTGTVTSHSGFLPNGDWLNEVDTLKLVVDPTGKTMTAVVTANRWQALRNGGEVSGEQPPAGSTFDLRIGSAFVLTYLRPGLLRSSTAPDGASLGNPYICSAATTSADQALCGA